MSTVIEKLTLKKKINGTWLRETLPLSSVGYILFVFYSYSVFYNVIVAQIIACLEAQNLHKVVVAERWSQLKENLLHFKQALRQTRCFPWSYRLFWCSSHELWRISSTDNCIIFTQKAICVTQIEQSSFRPLTPLL